MHPTTDKILPLKKYKEKSRQLLQLRSLSLHPYVHDSREEARISPKERTSYNY